ncbi:TonB-dependent receptor [Mucilaginibacter sp. UR6-1]|uniref:SusC/RagA family TonB-linked outer membrane protein n=1 Tax=Mucilaginibacter sp. UR6-1 TaxID=1435643 RepID=UPI001E643303|nr:TonB-dependent receptor [Mucilaginibacter sp. UR6-1]MCC8411274.1 TonB-dependent receptor [Mucilaginibacter sp. UR6-1]
MRQILQRLLLLSVFTCACAIAFAQSRVITGTVTNQSGETLPGATVTVTGTNVSVATNAMGAFSINVPGGSSSLTVSYLGMEKQQFTLTDKTNVSIALKPSATALEEVVVKVAYGSAKKANLSSAQTSISAKELNRTVNTTVEQALQGRSAGVYVTQNTGQPGGGMSINIRGVSTINGATDPLYVIDDIQIAPTQIGLGPQSSTNPLAGINPTDIEDIQVLQGPAATSLYGSRATNGVVLITTKRGKAGDVKLTYNYQYGLQTAPKHLDVMNLRQYAQMVGEYHAIAGGETPLEFLDPSLLGEGTNWQDELFRNSARQNHTLSLSGGTEKTKYYLSGDYLDQKGVAAGSGFKRYSARLNMDSKAKEWLTFGTDLNFSQTKENLTTSQENLISNGIQLTPQIPVKNIDGSWGGGDLNNGANQFAPVNPVAIANLVTNNFLRREFRGGLRADVKILPELHFKTSLTTNVGYSESQNYIPTYKIGWAENVTAAFTNATGSNTYWNWNQLLEYNKSFGKHNFNVIASHEAQAGTWKNLSARRTGFLTNDVFDIEAGDPLTASNGGGSGHWALESYLARINYNYNDRYIVSGAIRADGSSNFGSENIWGYFPSVSAAWRITNEKFWNIPAINELKLRVETGLTGNQGGGAGIYSPLAPGATPSSTGFLPSKFANPNLKWEETRTNNIGVNIGLLKDRINIEADYYEKETSNLLMDLSLPWYMGTNGTGAVGAPLVNIGTLTNKGWGVTLNTTNITNKNFTWTSNFNISHFKTTIKKLNSESAFISRTSWWLDNWTQKSAVGSAPWLFQGYIEEGIFQSVDEINNSAVPVDNNGNRLPTADVNGVWVGDVKYKDINGDGKIDVNDLTNIGNPWPKLYAGFTNNFAYKGFNLSVLLTAAYGNDVYNYLARANSNPNNINLSRNMLVTAMDYARPITNADGSVSLANPGTNVARISFGPNGNYARITDKWVEDGSFIRLKNVTLSYNVPANFLAKQKFVRGARIAFGVQNLATITGYKGLDPEVGSYVGRDAQATNQAIGLDNGRYPLTPFYTFSFGIDL